MTVKELINELLECNMESDVKLVLGFSDGYIEIEEDITEVIDTAHRFQDVTIQIDINVNLDEWIAVEDEEEA